MGNKSQTYVHGRTEHVCMHCCSFIDGVAEASHSATTEGDGQSFLYSMRRPADTHLYQATQREIVHCKDLKQVLH